MSSQDWYSIVSDKFDPLIGTGVSVTDSGGGGSTWKAYLDCWEEDKTIVHLAEGRHGFCGLESGISNGDELLKFISQQHSIAKSSYSQFLSDWYSQVRDDASALQRLKHISDRWSDDVWEPVHNVPNDTRESGVLKTWYGPGAQKYLTVVQKQAAAMDEINNMAQQAGTGLATTSSVIKTVTLAILHSVQPIKDKLAGWPKHKYGAEHSDDMIFGERTAYAAAQFQGLQQWLSGVLSDGEWTSTTDKVRIQFEDLKQKSHAFNANVWPKAVTNGIGDMKNGNGGLGDQANSSSNGPTGTNGTSTAPGGTTAPDPTSKGTTVKDDGSYQGNGGNSGGGDGPYSGDNYHGKDADGSNSGSQGAGGKYKGYE